MCNKDTPMTWDAVQSEVLRNALLRHKWNQTSAAAELRVSVRTIQRWRKRLKINRLDNLQELSQ